MKKLLLILLAVGLLAGCESIPYQRAARQWHSYQDLAQWMQRHFRFDPDRQHQVLRTMRESGPEAVTLRSPKAVYRDGGGYCADAANFAYQNLKRINPDYDPRFVFIENAMGPPNHWVTALTVHGKLYIMDYGTGGKWSDMQGLHGPYDKLSQYAAYLNSLDLPDFSLGSVAYRAFPGTATK